MRAQGVQNIEASRNNARDGHLNPGSGNPKVSTLVALARVLDEPVGHLLPDEINRGANGPWPPRPPLRASSR